MIKDADIMIKCTEYKNLRKVVHRVYCDTCQAELESTSTAYMTYPAQYEYICPICKKKSCFNQVFPWSEIVGDEIV